MTRGVQKTISMDPQVIIIAGSNDHLQSRGLLSRLTDGSIPCNEIMGEAIMTVLLARWNHQCSDTSLGTW